MDDGRRNKMESADVVPTMGGNVVQSYFASSMADPVTDANWCNGREYVSSYGDVHRRKISLLGENNKGCVNCRWLYSRDRKLSSTVNYQTEAWGTDIEFTQIKSHKPL